MWLEDFSKVLLGIGFTRETKVDYISIGIFCKGILSLINVQLCILVYI